MTTALAPVPDQFWIKHNKACDANKISQAVTGQCMVCGRMLNPATARVAVITGGGSDVIHPDSVAEWDVDNDRGFMGAWDLGPECHKMFPKGYTAPLTASVHTLAR